MDLWKYWEKQMDNDLPYMCEPWDEIVTVVAGGLWETFG